MNFINKIKGFFQMIAYMFMVFMSWLFILVFIYQMIVFFKTERYQTHDIPNEKFQVLTLTADKQFLPVYFRELTNQTLVTSIDKNERLGEDYLRQEGDTFIYHNEGALWNTESKYKVVNNQVQPISFVFMTFIEAFEALILSFIFYAMAKYVWLRFWYRKKQDKISELNQASIKRSKGFMIFIGIVIAFYGFFYGMNLALK